MKKGQMCEGIVEKVKFPNKGIVKVEDSEVTVKNTIPGQKVSYVINKKRKGKAEGRLLEILEKSELEKMTGKIGRSIGRKEQGTWRKNWDLSEREIWQVLSWVASSVRGFLNRKRS